MKKIVTPSLFAAAVVGSGLLLARKNTVFAQEETPPAAAQVTREGWTVVDASSERSTEFSEPGQVLEPGSRYMAVIETSAGTLDVELYADRTPVTVNNFVFLALNRYYDGIVFHRVLEDFMAQTGDPTGTGTGGPGYQFEDEFDPELKHDGKGTLSMANAGPGTNGSQFFITFRDTPHLDGRHSVFGRVTDGFDVLDQLTRIDPQQPTLIVEPGDTLEELEAEGIRLEGDSGQTLAEYLEETLGAMPPRGRTFEVDGRTAMLGTTQGGQQVAGFWPVPDFMERVTILKQAAD